MQEGREELIAKDAAAAVERKQMQGKQQAEFDSHWQQVYEDLEASKGAAIRIAVKDQVKYYCHQNSL